MINILSVGNCPHKNSGTLRTLASAGQPISGGQTSRAPGRRTAASVEASHTRDSLKLYCTRTQCIANPLRKLRSRGASEKASRLLETSSSTPQLATDSRIALRANLGFKFS